MKSIFQKNLIVTSLLLSQLLFHCKLPRDSSIKGDLGGSTAMVSGFQQLKIILGYAGLSVVQNNNPFMFGQQGGQTLTRGTMVAVFDLNGNQISGVIVKRLQFIQTQGTTNPQSNGVAALGMGTQGLPSYSIDLDIGDMYCSSLDQVATLVVGVAGDLACFAKNTDQGRFVENCLQPGAMGHVELNSTNPVCVSKVIPTYATPVTNGTMGNQRELTGDPMILDYSYTQHRDTIKYLPLFRQLQSICDNPSMPSGHLVSQGMTGNSSAMDLDPSYSGLNSGSSDPLSPSNSTNSTSNSAGTLALASRPLTYCQCRPMGGLSRNVMPVTFDLLAESRRIYRNLQMWKGVQPPKDPLMSFQQACQDGTTMDLPLPPNLSGPEANMMKNEALCGQLQNSGKATISQDRCLCSRNSQGSYRSSGYDSGYSGQESSYSSFNQPNSGQNIAVDFNVPVEQFVSQCLMITDSMTTREFCETNSMLRYDQEYSSTSSTTSSTSKGRSGCRGCPGQMGSAGSMYRSTSETLTNYALRCMGVSK